MRPFAVVCYFLGLLVLIVLTAICLFSTSEIMVTTTGIAGLVLALFLAIGGSLIANSK